MAEIEEEIEGAKRGPVKPHTKRRKLSLTQKQWLKWMIFNRSAMGDDVTDARLAAKFGITTSMIGMIRRGKSYRTITPHKPRSADIDGV